MSTVRKFTFDLDFDAPEEPDAVEAEAIEDEPEEEIAPTYSEEDLERARQEGFDAGRESGRLEAAEATEQRLLEAVETAAAQIETVIEGQVEANRDVAKEMIQVANTITKKMFPDLNARNALGEVERVTQDTLKAITEEPRVQIILHPDIREPFMERLSVMTNRAGFDGKVFVNPDPTMTLGDCRVEWSNGAAVRDSKELSKMIDEIVQRNLHGDDEDYDPAPMDHEDEPAASAPELEPAPELSEPQLEMDAAPAPQDEPDSTPAPAPEIDAAPEPASESAPGDKYADDDPLSDAPHVDENASETPPAPADDDTAAQHDESDFAPTLEPEGDQDFNDLNQSLDQQDAAPPTPHIDGAEAADAAVNTDGDGENAPGPAFTSPDPVSPEMASAILDAQGIDEDDPDSNV